MRPVIRVDKLSKLYQLGEIGTGTISHDLNRWWARRRGKDDPFSVVGATNDRTINDGNKFAWALRDISFEVQQGEVLGILGRNGAGKSTLLKVLSRVTTPTSGHMDVKGRIASLLEVGTGFHPEMTGRENIFMNGAILGMTKAEIRQKFDDIVDFAGVAKYIDTPVKRYSSGMYVRLAFAVAAYLEPEILIVDEVLAVGDAEFQKKCLGRMKDVSVNDGRTVLFVSHNMNAIKTLCTRAVCLRNGELIMNGDVQEVIDQYTGYDSDIVTHLKWAPQNAPGDDIALLYSARLIDRSGNDVDCLDFYEGGGIEITYEILKEGFQGYPNFHFYHNDQAVVIISAEDQCSPSGRGVYRTVVEIPPHFLNDGRYSVGIAVTSYPLQVVNFFQNPCLVFDVVEDDLNKRGHPYRGVYPCLVRPRFFWSTEKL